VGSNRARQLRRARQQVERRRNARATGAHETQKKQAAAEAQRDFALQHRRHVRAYVLFAVGGLLATYHLMEHLGVVPPISGSAGLDDFVAGWPLAAVLAIVGAITYGT